MSNQLKSTIKHSILSRIYSKRVNIKLKEAVFSFTFDDVPLSGAKNGSRILENYGARGTYYISSKLNKSNPPNPERLYNIGENTIFATDEDIKDLHEKGHEIACHSYSHMLRSEEHTSELQSRPHLVCRLLLEKKNKKKKIHK